MSDLTPPSDFHLLLDFAFGMAARGIPLSIVAIAPDAEIADDDRAYLGRTFAEATRRTDRIAAMEGELWVAMLVDCNRQGALIYADRTVDRVETWRAEKCGVSCGIALYRDGMSSVEELLAAARSALEAARAAGGDRVEIHGE